MFQCVFVGSSHGAMGKEPCGGHWRKCSELIHSTFRHFGILVILIQKESSHSEPGEYVLLLLDCLKKRCIFPLLHKKLSFTKDFFFSQ